ncbi:CidA/LrgA family protein [Clostridium hydrogenum]|uniref:CidA/LrgA family protein n=1 Tax=Clostridium hydrogenum TaxID=2855764 RepID=UPI001F1BE480|nr:CidA/LrgA family protein [Clostridium hydrogenum]
MKYIRQLAIILLFCFLGQVISTLFKLPIPGNVLGMLLMVIALCLGIIKLEAVEEVSNSLLEYLPFFFVPAGVGLITSFKLIKDTWILLIIVVVITTIITMAITGLTVQAIKGRKK